MRKREELSRNRTGLGCDLQQAWRNGQEISVVQRFFVEKNDRVEQRALGPRVSETFEVFELRGTGTRAHRKTRARTAIGQARAVDGTDVIERVELAERGFFCGTKRGVQPATLFGVEVHALAVL